MQWLERFALITVMPASPELPGIEDTDLSGFLTRFHAEAHWLHRLGFFASALVFMLSPLITVGIPVPALFLNRRLRERHANRVADHPLYLMRQTMMILKTIGAMGWGMDARVRERLGVPIYGPDPGTWRTT